MSFREPWNLYEEYPGGMISMSMNTLLHRHTVSFRHALDGVRWALMTQPNFRIHLLFAAFALFLSWYLAVSPVEFTVIILTIVLGLSAEMINTALEAMTDLITKEWREEAKIAKDVSAGMMLTVAVGAVIVACYIFGPKLMTRFLI